MATINNRIGMIPEDQISSIDPLEPTDEMSDSTAPDRKKGLLERMRKLVKESKTEYKEEKKTFSYALPSRFSDLGMSTDLSTAYSHSFNEPQKHILPMESREELIGEEYVDRGDDESRQGFESTVEPRTSGRDERLNEDTTIQRNTDYEKDIVTLDAQSRSNHEDENHDERTKSNTGNCQVSDVQKKVCKNEVVTDLNTADTKGSKETKRANAEDIMGKDARRSFSLKKRTKSKDLADDVSKKDVQDDVSVKSFFSFMTGSFSIKREKKNTSSTKNNEQTNGNAKKDKKEKQKDKKKDKREKKIKKKGKQNKIDEKIDEVDPIKNTQDEAVQGNTTQDEVSQKNTLQDEVDKGNQANTEDGIKDESLNEINLMDLKDNNQIINEENMDTTTNSENATDSSTTKEERSGGKSDKNKNNMEPDNDDDILVYKHQCFENIQKYVDTAQEYYDTAQEYYDATQKYIDDTQKYVEASVQPLVRITNIFSKQAPNLKSNPREIIGEAYNHCAISNDAKKDLSNDMGVLMNVASEIAEHVELSRCNPLPIEDGGATQQQKASSNSEQEGNHSLKTGLVDELKGYLVCADLETNSIAYDSEKMMHNHCDDKFNSKAELIKSFCLCDYMQNNDLAEPMETYEVVALPEDGNTSKITDEKNDMANDDEHDKSEALVNNHIAELNTKNTEKVSTDDDHDEPCVVFSTRSKTISFDRKRGSLFDAEVQQEAKSNPLQNKSADNS